MTFAEKILDLLKNKKYEAACEETEKQILKEALNEDKPNKYRYSAAKTILGKKGYFPLWDKGVWYDEWARQCFTDGRAAFRLTCPIKHLPELDPAEATKARDVEKLFKEMKFLGKPASELDRQLIGHYIARGRIYKNRYLASFDNLKEKIGTEITIHCGIPSGTNLFGTVLQILGSDAINIRPATIGGQKILYFSCDKGEAALGSVNMSEED